MEQKIKQLKQEKIALLFGGTSAEREVSLNSGQAILRALQHQGFNVTAIDTQNFPIEQLKQQGFDRVFNILHGRGGEDGTLQGLLEQLGIPYTGCGVMASALSMDKLRTKMLWHAFGLPVAEMEVVTLENRSQLDAAKVIEKLGLPVMVKPSLEGSSIGLTKVNKVEELARAVDFALQYDQTVLIEKWLAGEEFSVPVLDKQVLPAVRIKPAGDFYDYHAKYIADDTQYFCPAGLSEEKEQELRQLAKKAFDILGCRGWARIDVMTDAVGKFYLVEANTCPGMTSHSLFPMSAKVEGYSFEQLVTKVLALSITE
ncbi:D-alanine--D-alanine ligase [Mergibacter septicus]|uniref:D-alanine--D-alanine ligase n=1 Tax=Mergibacter septicus TaxID=221402 RepID=A0A8D4IX47_9PAST|nr:D-alanine--D-alanine ligase [Mergibacter septicus]AWX14996.1 D-alanine--D-alanine ligase [Mergibacter septicus]QDJ14248.1 D-alanine--D-alanine ligase [Mergibacter septicus]UTU48307.1 D-alanine--D-alanine ligase [Mergibacter septicus]WMR96070.1 D-alanine--D-alanine ligase [Mergibacter septicus]